MTTITAVNIGTTPNDGTGDTLRAGFNILNTNCTNLNNGKPEDNAVVHNSGNETVNGIKTFGSFPVTPSSAPTTNYEVANKKYVDDNVAGFPEGTQVKSTGEVGGVKFLREDGDGTCSWQTPAGSGDMLLGTVQTVTAEKIFDKDKISTKGTSTGKTIISTANTSATDYTQTLPARNGTVANLDDVTYIGTTSVALNRTSGALTLAGITLTTPDIGTPSAGTLTNCTGLPIGGITQNTARLLGRTTAGAGETEEIIVSTGLSLSAGTLTSSIGGNTTDNIGYLNIPQNSKSEAYTTVLADSGKHIYHPSADTTARTITIDSNANVAYPIGTAITFINDTSAGVLTIAITSDTLVLAGAGTTGSRTLAANGIATAIKVTSTRWVISGTNLT